MWQEIGKQFDKIWLKFSNVANFCQQMSKCWRNNCENVEFRAVEESAGERPRARGRRSVVKNAVQECVNVVDLNECCERNVHLQK